MRLRAAAIAFAVLVPALAHAVCAPSARGIFPASGIVGTQVDAVVEGDSLAGATVTVFGDAGLAAAVQSTGDLTVNLRLTIDAAAVPGERILVLDTAGGSVAVSFTVNPPGGPIVAAVSPPLIATVGLPLDVTITGANLVGVTAVSVAVSGNGVAVATAIPSGDGTSLALSFTVDALAELGTHAVTISNGVGSAVLQLYVRRPAPTVTELSPAAGEIGATVPITITGTNLAGAALVITTPPGGDVSDVVITDVVTPDDATLTATLTIGAAVPPSDEPRLLIVTTESGQTTVEFFVVAAGVPTVTGIEPGAGEPTGTPIPVTIRGLHFTGLVSVTPSSLQLTLGTPTVVDDETITLTVTVDVAATVNFDRTLTVTTAAGADTVTFRVIPVGDPFVGAVRPPFGNRGSTFTMVVKGVNLALVVPGTGIDIIDPSEKITESNALALDNKTAQALIDVDLQANAGTKKDVEVTLTNAKSFTKTELFRVNIPGQVPTITDVTPGIVEPGVTTPMTVTGSGFEGGAVLVTGPGVTITNVVVDPSGTIITFDLTLAADAPAETRAVIVVTENGTARCNIASNPSPPPLVAAKLVKTGALFTVASTVFRLFVFEFSINDLFTTGLRTVGIAEPGGSLTLDRQDTVAIEQAFRDAHRGWVRVRAVTATNRIAVSTPEVIRR